MEFGLCHTGSVRCHAARIDRCVCGGGVSEWVTILADEGKREQYAKGARSEIGADGRAASKGILAKFSGTGRCASCTHLMFLRSKLTRGGSTGAWNVWTCSISAANAEVNVLGCALTEVIQEARTEVGGP